MKTHLFASLFVAAALPALAASAPTPVQNRSNASRQPALARPSGSSPRSAEEVRAAYNRVAREAEEEYARLIAAERSDMEKSKAQIKRLDEQIAALRQAPESRNVLGARTAASPGNNPTAASQATKQAGKLAQGRAALEAAQSTVEARETARRVAAEIAALEKRQRTEQDRLAAAERRVVAVMAYLQQAADLRRQMLEAVLIL